LGVLNNSHKARRTHITGVSSPDHGWRVSGSRRAVNELVNLAAICWNKWCRLIHRGFIYV